MYPEVRRLPGAFSLPKGAQWSPHLKSASPSSPGLPFTRPQGSGSEQRSGQRRALGRRGGCPRREAAPEAVGGGPFHCKPRPRPNSNGHPIPGGALPPRARAQPPPITQPAWWQGAWFPEGSAAEKEPHESAWEPFPNGNILGILKENNIKPLISYFQL